MCSLWWRASLGKRNHHTVVLLFFVNSAGFSFRWNNSVDDIPNSAQRRNISDISVEKPYSRLFHTFHESSVSDEVFIVARYYPGVLWLGELLNILWCTWESLIIGISKCSIFLEKAYPALTEITSVVIIDDDGMREFFFWHIQSIYRELSLCKFTYLYFLILLLWFSHIS